MLTAQRVVPLSRALEQRRSSRWCGRACVQAENYNTTRHPAVNQTDTGVKRGVETSRSADEPPNEYRQCQTDYEYDAQCQVQAFVWPVLLFLIEMIGHGCCRCFSAAALTVTRLYVQSGRHAYQTRRIGLLER